MAMGKLGAGGRGFGKEGSTSLGRAGVSDGIFNYSPAYLANWRAARDAAIAGTSSAILSYGPGDSTTVGTGATKALSAPNVLAQKLTALGIPAANEGFYSTHGSAVPGTIDTHLSVGAGWNITTSQFTYFGRCFLGTAATGPLSYTPYASVDTWDIYYCAYSGGGVISLTVNGGAEIASVDTTNASTIIQVYTLTVPAGTNRLDITKVSGAPLITAAIGRTAATKQINIYNGGQGGAVLTSYIAAGGSAYHPRPFYKTLAPKLSILSMTINDANTATSIGTYQTNIDTMIADGKLSGDVIVMDGPPSQAATVPIATQKSYRDVARARAIANNCVYISLTDRWGSWEAKNAQGWYFDNLHPNATGYDDIATLLATVLAR